jgi:hypothetical protein
MFSAYITASIFQVSMLLSLVVPADSGTLRRSGSKVGNWSKVRIGAQKRTAWDLVSGMDSRT